MTELSKNGVVTVKIKEVEDPGQNAFRNPILEEDVEKDVRTLNNIFDKVQKLFNLDPNADTDKPLKIDLNLDQLEDFKE